MMMCKISIFALLNVVSSSALLLPLQPTDLANLEVFNLKKECPALLDADIKEI